MLDKNLFDVAPDQIAEGESLATMMGGRSPAFTRTSARYGQTYCGSEDAQDGRQQAARAVCAALPLKGGQVPDATGYWPKYGRDAVMASIAVLGAATSGQQAPDCRVD